MIEFLSSESWINPQVDFLLFLQNIRISYFEMFNRLFLSITILGEIWLPTLLCAIVYWCIDSKSGVYLFSLFGFNGLLLQLFKMIACIYRPWILSDKIKPVKEAVIYAKGYSFPSGHSCTSASVFGGLAYLSRKKIIASILLVLLVLLVGFSRLWLGVHTPQDVIIGLTIGFTLVFILSYLINWAEKDKNRYLILLLVVNIFALLSLAYIVYFGVYPCDYIDGKILVNSCHAVYTAIIYYGYVLGLLNGAYLCRRFFPFDSSAGSLKSKLIRGITGSFCIIILLRLGMHYLFRHNCNYKFAFLGALVIGLFVTLIYPIIFKKWLKK